MISTTQDEIYKTFAAISEGHRANLDDSVKSLSDVVAEMSKAQPIQNLQPQTKTTSKSTGGSDGAGVLDTVESVASTVLKSGFGIVPLVGELFGLFGGGDSSTPPPLVKYAMPEKLSFQGAETNSGLSNFDYGQSGMPRAYTAASPDNRGTDGMPHAESGGSSINTGAQSNAIPASQITVNVQAMDARSFLDRSNDIALAVRDAMLNLSSINDVINDL